MSVVILWLVLGVLLLLGIQTLIRWFVAADPRTLATAAQSAGIALLVVVVILLGLTGRLGWLFAVIPLVLPMFWRRLRWGGAGSFRGRGFGSGGPASSGIRTPFLDMQLDHHTGALDGQVLLGACAGRRLSDLPLDELLQLQQNFTTADRKSALLLEAYLDRRFPDWRQTGSAGTGATGNSRAEQGRTTAGSGSAPGSAGGPMSRDEALRILGLAPGADAAAIKAAHLRLIAIVHPDRGGSPFLAAQVNRARDVLLDGGPGA